MQRHLDDELGLTFIAGHDIADDRQAPRSHASSDDTALYPPSRDPLRAGLEQVGNMLRGAHQLTQHLGFAPQLHNR